MKESENYQEINLREIISPYIKRWYLYVLAILICLVLAYIYVKKQNTQYSVQTTVLIKDSKKNGGIEGADFLKDLSGFGKFNSEGVDNEIEIFKSKRLMQQVVKNLNLQTKILKQSKFTDKELWKSSSPIEVLVVTTKKSDYIDENNSNKILLKVNKDILEISSEDFTTIKTTYNKLISLPMANIIITKNPKYNQKDSEKNQIFHIEIQDVESCVNEYQKLLNVSLVNKDASVIKLELPYSNIDKAKDILNNLVNVYNVDAINDKNAESKKTAQFIDDRIKSIANDLGSVENQKEQFKTSNRITDIQTEAEINLKTSAAAIDKELEINSQLELNNSVLAYINKQNIGQTLPTNIGLSNPTVATSITNYNQLVIERNRLLENSTPKNPLVEDITKQLNNLKSSITEGLNKNKVGLELAKSQYDNQLGKINNRISQVPSQEKIFRSIERQQQIKENLYLLLLQKREETQISLAVTAPKARVVDYAFANRVPVAPKKMIIILIGLISGILIPTLYIYIKELFNDKIKTKHDIEKLTNGKTIIGEIPKKEKNTDELLSSNDLSPMAEAFRILITNMKFMLPKKNDEANIIFVTSSVKGEGKTYVAANLSVILATPKNKVLLIGSDIRNPQLQRFNTDRKGVKGLTEYLSDESVTSNDIILTSVVNPNLDVIFSGTIPPNPTELLNNGRFDLLLQEVKSKYKYIIVDTAPTMLVTDTMLISNLSDMLVYVTRSRYTENNIIKYVNNLIEDNKLKNVGLVINDVDKESLGYGNKYGYGYNNQEKSWFKKIIDKI